MNVLILQSGKLGDMVCTTPMFRAVKEKYPNAHLVVMGNKLNGEVVAGNPHVDEYLVSPDSVDEFKVLLRDRHIDVAISATPVPNALRAFLAFRIKKIIVPRITGGWSPMVTHTYRFFSLFAIRVSMAFGEYVPRAYLRLLEPLGIYTDDTRKELFVTEAAHKRMAMLLPDNSGKLLVGIAPGVGNGRKNWGGERFAEVATALYEAHGATIVILGSERDAEQVAAMRQALPQDVPVVDLAHSTSIEELKAAIARLKLFISVDSGPLYIAEAFAIPTIDIVGPMDEREQPPRGPLHRVVVPPNPRKAVLHIFNATVVDEVEARRQVDVITPNMVITETQNLIQDITS